MSLPRGALHAGAVALLFALTACRGNTPDRPQPSSMGTAPATTALPPVTLPDLADMDAVVQKQIADQFATVTSLVNERPASAVLASAYGRLGSLLFAANRANAAEACYLHAKALATGEVRWPYYLGHVYLNRPDRPKAIAAFERALQLAPGDAAALVWLGKVYLDDGQPAQAETRFTQALAAQPRMAAALYGLGQAALAMRDYTRAVEHFEQVLAADPRASIVHYPLALAYRGLGDTARAEAHLRRQGKVQIGPPDPLMAELRGLLAGSAAEEARGLRALDGGDFKTAAEHFRKGVEFAPDNASLRHRLGTALSLMGERDAARDAFEETLRRSPRYAPAHYSLAVVLAAEGRMGEAIDHLRAAVAADPASVEARLRLGELLGRSGQYEAALEQYRQALTIDPRASDARFGYAGALVGLRRYREAVESLSESAKLYPDEPRFKEALARVQSAVR